MTLLWVGLAWSIALALSISGFELAQQRPIPLFPLSLPVMCGAAAIVAIQREQLWLLFLSLVLLLVFAVLTMMSTGVAYVPAAVCVLWATFARLWEPAAFRRVT